MTRIIKSNLFLSTASALLLVFMMAQFGAGQNVYAQCSRPGFKLAYGNFSHGADYATARDFNGDNKVDIATLSASTGKVVVYLGDGTGGFSAPAVYQVATGFQRLIAGDINGDGKLDLFLATGSFFNFAVSILINNGSGAFGPPINTSIQTDSFYLEVHDFNGDGKGDLYSHDEVMGAPVFQIRFGDGAGNFAAPVNYNMTGVRAMGVGDFNGDGKKDVAWLSGDIANRTLILHLNNGSGTMVPGTPFPINADTTLNLRARDVNGDGKDDLLGVTQATNAVTLLLNNGSGGFTKSDYPALPRLIDLETGDFNGDGKLDVILSQAVTNNPNYNASMLFGDGLGGFTRLDYRTGHPNGLVFLGATTSGARADFNGDNLTDLVMPTGSSSVPLSGLRIWQRTCNLNTNTKRIDYTGDGLGDYALWRPSNGVWNIKLGANSFRTVQWGLGSLGDVPVPGDYDGDGKSDIAVFRAPEGAWYVLRSSDNSGYGIQWGTNGDKPAPGDYDADGKTDFAVFRPSTGAWYILRSSDGTMASYIFGTNGDTPVQFDYDGDDKADVAVFRPSNGAWYILRSSDGSFSGQFFGQNGDRPVPGDYDGDGRGDITVYRAGVGFYSLRSWNNSLSTSPNTAYAGTPTAADMPAPIANQDFVNLAVWRPANGYITTTITTSGVMGTSGDIPVTAPYVIE